MKLRQKSLALTFGLEADERTASIDVEWPPRQARQTLRNAP